MPSAVRLRQRPRWLSSGEGTIKSRPSDSYAAKKAALEDAEVRLSLDLMEEAMVAEPDNWAHRKQVGDVIWDTSQPGLALASSIENDEIVFLTFVDLFLA